MTDEQAARLEEKLDRLDRITPIIEALGAILVRRNTVNDRVGLNKNTLNNKPAFEEIGKRKTYIEVGEVAVVKRRKRNKITTR
jgi:hypothetical protein